MEKIILNFFDVIVVAEKVFEIRTKNFQTVSYNIE